MAFRGNGRKLVEDIQEHLLIIKKLLARVVQLADRDETIVRAAMQTHVETLLSMVALVGQSASKLPDLKDDPQPVSLETAGAELGAIETGRAANGRARRERMTEVKRKTRREN